MRPLRTRPRHRVIRPPVPAWSRRLGRPCPIALVATRRPVRVLCIEDTKTNLEILRLYLARPQGYEALGAEDGERGLEIARRECPDVILLDINLPGMDGIEVKARLAADPRAAAIPVFALSAGAVKTDIDRALGAGFVE